MASSWKERIVSGLGGGAAILVVFWLMRETEAAMHLHVLLLASMGATAVLLFAVPHGPMSQPWNVIGGHVFSAMIGVTVHAWVADPVLAGSLALGLSITVMHFLRCLHPPGGATSLIPVTLGGVSDDYGVLFVLFPVGAAAAAMVAFAVLFNLPFAWRRYPAWLWPKPAAGTPQPSSAGYPDITHADFVAALAEIDTFVDISEDDLLRIYHIATRRAG